MADLKVLVAGRGHCKGSITKMINFMESELFLQQSIDKLKATKERVCSVFSDYNKYCVQIKALDPQDTEDPNTIEDNYLDLIAYLDKLIRNKSAFEMQAVPCASKIKLPNIVIPTFTEVKQHLAALRNLSEPVDSWGSIVLCILSRKLDMLTSRGFQMERDTKSRPTVKEFLDYLEHRALALENTEYSPKPQGQRLVTHAVVAQQASPSCIYCKSAHKLFQCPSFKMAAPQKRVEFAKTNKLCNICLSLHKGKCKFHFRCDECNKKDHNTLLHYAESQQHNPSVTLLSSTSQGQVLLPTARVKLLSQSGTTIFARALLDSASQASFVTQKVVELLGITPNKSNTTIIGITNTEQAVNQRINLEVHSTVYPFKINVDCHIVQKITSKLPQAYFNKSQFTFPAHYKLADESFNTPGDVHLLLGADVFFQVLLPQSESSQGPASFSTPHSKQPSIVHTSFGHIVAGHNSNVATPATSMKKVVSLFCQECDNSLNESLSAFWKSEQVPEIYPDQLPEHQYCEIFFNETVKLENNKFQVTMPLKVPLEQVNSELGESFHLALKRFYNLEKRLQKNSTLLAEYTKFINQYIDLKHGEYHDIGNYDLANEPVFFLPHHAVIKENSKTTKLRTVFDASMRTNKRVSLNDLLLNGPVVQKDLFSILLSFRLGRFFFICDIQKMFRCINLVPSQRSLQNILWRESPSQDIRCIQLSTVTYGLKPSSYLATRCLIELASRYNTEYPLASSILKENTYIDDILCNSHSKATLVKMQSELMQILALGGFQLHKWASNCQSILTNVPAHNHHFGELDLKKHDDTMSLKTLGVIFDVKGDAFRTECPERYNSQRDSKRDILSYISKFYDPIGLIGPIFVQAKVIMQKLWSSDCGWDETPPEDIRKVWTDFVRDLQQMEPLVIPRCVNIDGAVTRQLIGFADASAVAYGCCLYLRTVDQHNKNEYLGITERLVITPLTDRCYITLAQAIGMSMGGAPAGPAGTGKTETTKDMGRTLGKLVIVFNCSDQMDFRGLGRIYKGLAQSGTWGCFDEFNRIELPVLSVAAQQIYICLTARREKKDFFIFSDGDTVTLNPEFAFIITMNPGYAGRQELPENLKIQFRSVAMMVPDRQIIIRVKLASCGFKENIILSRKFFTLYKLCEEQLSKQVHYDFGLRNILSVLRTMGAQKRANPDSTEENIMMRVLKEMNVSKLVDEDEPLFVSLIEDLFPGMKLTQTVQREMQRAIAVITERTGLVNHSDWNLKIIQLFETSLVRHGLMTMGPTGSGKTTCIHTLMAALTEVGKPHREMRMNPKAITAAQMFGRLDVATNDWTDGIFSTLWRRALKVKKSDTSWIVLDGPVDAVWIENLNSVLDDNKTLTLANGDRISMASNSKLVFEPDNVDNASPATVSRVGMVFLSSSVLKWQPILEGWLKKRPQKEYDALKTAFYKVYDDVHAFLQQKLVSKMKLLEAIYIRQAIDVLCGLLEIEVPGGKTHTDRHLERLFIFAMMWSLGAVLELDARTKMAEFMTKLPVRMDWPGAKLKEWVMPFEYMVNENGQWQHWSESVEDYLYPTDYIPEYASILVPNIDNVCISFLIDTIAKQNKAVLLIGEQGTAKTVMLKSYMTAYNNEVKLFKMINFSSATTPNMFQRIIESYVEKRVGMTYGPPSGRAMTVFVDDINMPVINAWGDQVTNEIVRQMMECGGFFSLDKPGDFITIADIQMFGAMIHPGGGRNDIPPRLKRQFNIFNCTLPSDVSMDRIFETISAGYFCKPRFDKKNILEFMPRLVPVTRIIWQQTKVKMLPTPAKFHYVFNLRDLSRIWEGILFIHKEELPNINVAIKLWFHECLRVICDRFTTFEDKSWFVENFWKTAAAELPEFVSEFPDQETFFVNFLRDPIEPTGDEDEDFSTDAPKVYEELPAWDFVLYKLKQFQDLFNEQVRGAHLDLVFFHDAMVHLFIISRVINTPRGNSLLVGVGGSGKQSLTKLASFIANYTFYQITLTRSYNVSNFMDDIKILYRIAGLLGRGVSFIFTDNEIKDEQFLEFLNNILSSGEIANLFPKEEMDEILNELTPIMKKLEPKRIPVPDVLYEYFIMRSRANLHVVLCFSPVGEKFRSRALKFPGLISGSTMDWFQKWPKAALIEVASHFLAEFNVVCSPQTKTQLIEIMGTVQDNVADTCISYYEKFRRQTHVTPKSYLSFLEGYKTLYKHKHEYIGEMARRMTTGLDKLVEAAQSVDILKKELELMELEIKEATAKAEEVLAAVADSQAAAEVVKAEVLDVKDRAVKLVSVIAAETAIAEEKLADAKPALDAAEAALLTINAADIATVRKLGKPPYLITLIMDAVIILFRKKLESVKPDPEKRFLMASWGESLKVMADSRFLNNLKFYPRDEINAEMIDFLIPYFKYPQYTFEAAKIACGNVAGLISWTIAMAQFYGVNKDVLPLKANLAVMQAKYQGAKRELQYAEYQLAEKERELAGVQREFDEAMRLKQLVLDDAAKCQQKMDAATALINGLSGERIRWTEQSALFKSEIERLVGDILLLIGFLSYSGPFNQEFRTLLNRNWLGELLRRKIPVSMNLNVTEQLTDTATIGEWNLCGLPTDDLSIQNGIIVTKASRFPLLIDPQTQGKIWIKNMERYNDLIVTTLNHKYFRNHIEDAVSLGRPLIIEDVAEELDPALDNILEKNYIKIGSTYKVKLGDKEIDVTAGHRIYITTKLPNPAYTPEISARTSIIDFTVTMQGLEDQLLGRVILMEKAEMEAERTQLIMDVTANRRKMQELEANLLEKLTTIQGSLVEDVSLIQVLNITKSTATEVKEKLDGAKETEEKINAAREEFRPIATRGSVLYFLVCNMSLVCHMYQTSLAQFLERFDISMERSTPSPITSRRCGFIIEYLTFDVFKFISRGFYEVHKYLFTLLLTLKIDLNREYISFDEFQNFIKGGAALDLNACSPKPFKWITDMSWLNLVQLSTLRQFSNILNQVTNNEKGWKSWFDKEAPENESLPDGYHTLDVFRKLLMVRAWCPDRTLAQSLKYVVSSMGAKYSEAVIVNYEHMVLESRPLVPLVGFLAMGSDPTPSIEMTAKRMECVCSAISMGQGQEVHARKLISRALKEGIWVLLQNCHLGLEYMVEVMEQFGELEKEPEKIHETFRLWITTEVHPKFPITLLQMSIKYTCEPPSGIKAGLMRTYDSMSQDFLDYSDSAFYLPLIYTISFLHTVVQERRKFGPLGWNIPYEFNSADWLASCMFVQNHLESLEPGQNISWVTVRYMVSAVQYGGRVTDDYDTRLLITFCRVWFTETLFSEDFQFYKEYGIMKFKNIPEYLEEIEKMKTVDPPQAYGLHTNADITYQRNKTQDLLDTILSIQPKESTGGGGETREASVYRQSQEMLEKIPPDYDPHEVKERLKLYGQFGSMVIFLRQEIDRMQKVISLVRTTLEDLLLAIDGTIIMNEALRDSLDNIYDAKVPNIWLNQSWSSSTLGFWFTEFLERNIQFSSWCFIMRPHSFWMTGFFNPQGFLTAMRQEVTRAHKGWALDMVALHNDVTKSTLDEIKSPPVEGVFVHGMYLDGAGWDRRNHRLCESTLKVLYTALPVTHIYAINSTAPKDPKLYQCPVYKKPVRTGLTFITPLWLPTIKNPDHWILRGVAILCDIK